MFVYYDNFKVIDVVSTSYLFLEGNISYKKINVYRCVNNFYRKIHSYFSCRFFLSQIIKYL